MIYKSSFDEAGKWCSPYSMHREFSRLTLRVVDIYAAKVQRITPEECIAEGLTTKLRESEACGDLIEQYRKLWNRINSVGGCGWDTDPFCWVMTFRRLT